jgi:hypothetical protein
MNDIVGPQALGPAADVYAFGVILWELSHVLDAPTAKPTPDLMKTPKDIWTRCSFSSEGISSLRSHVLMPQYVSMGRHEPGPIWSKSAPWDPGSVLGRAWLTQTSMGGLGGAANKSMDNAAQAAFEVL